MTKDRNTIYPWQPFIEKEDCCKKNESIISVENLCVKYGNKTAVDSINLKISKGCITALVGPSGCGKSTVLHSLNRLIDTNSESSVSGRILFEGSSVTAKEIDTRELRTQIGLIFQKPNPFPLSIRKNITLTLKEHGIRNRTDQEEIMQNSLQSVGLWHEVKDRLNSSALKLSGGQQQRLCIARALVLKPKVLLMDEPCSALDPISSGVVEDLIEEMRGRYTVVIITHNLAQARRISDFVGVFWVEEQKGRLVEFGPTQEIFEKPVSELTRAYIGGLRG